MVVCYDLPGNRSSTRPHWHSAVEMALVLQNPLIVIEGGVSRQVAEGDVSLINSDVVHTTRARDARQSKGLVVLLSIEMLKTACPDFEGSRLVIPPQGDTRQRIIGVLTEIYQCKQQSRPYSQALTNALLWKLVWYLLDGCLVKGEESRSAAQKEDYLARQALSYIEQHFKEELSLSQLAAHVGLQENYFCRYFRKYVGMSFGQYLAQVRLRYALAWQASIVREYARPDQFVTHNLDFNWTGYSNGIQSEVDHDRVAECLDIAGCDIYHPTQASLTGIEIAQSGDQTRSLKNAPYLVLETEAQGFPSWTPFPGQLRLQAISHLASGAEMVEYWHWHSIHNSMETYWKGLLSHDFKPSAIYQEAKTVGREFAKLSGALNGLHKENKVAILVSNIALTSLKYFPISGGMFGGNIDYNSVVRWMYQTLYHMNVGVDFIYADSLPEGADLSKYSLICIPALYAAPESLLRTLLSYEEKGGTLLATFKTAFADENIKVYHDEAPHILSQAFGLSYSQFTVPENVTLDGIGGGEAAINWMELLIPENGTEVLSHYDHPYWKAYAAVTRAKYGNGQGYYIGCHAGEKVLAALMTEVLKTAGVDTPFAGSPVTVRQSVDSEGRKVTFLLNYSMQPVNVTVPASVNLLTDEQYPDGAGVTLPDWGYLIIRE